MSPWRCFGDRAVLSRPTLEAALDLARPWLGLHDIVHNAQSFSGMRLLRIHSNPGAETETIVDRYVRGEDLVISYSQTEKRPVSLHAYWRAFVHILDGTSVAGVDLIVSMQTDRLDSDPSLQVLCDVPSGEWIHAEGGESETLLRPNGGEVSLLLAAHPWDCEAMTCRPAGNQASEVAFHLFRPGLEKGVIRRARLRAAMIPKEKDKAIAAACFASFLADELPLTT